MTDPPATIPIPSPFPPKDESNETLDEYLTFWDLPSTAEWFERRGYTLYHRKEPAFEGHFEASAYPALDCGDSGEMDYPFSHYDLETSRTGKLHGKSYNVSLLVVDPQMTI
jgi:hypothetical protein